MKRIFKKNQIIITALALMLAIAGYINYIDSLKKTDEDKAVNNLLSIGETDAVNGDILSNDAEPDADSLTEPGQAILTGSTSQDVSYVQSEFIVNAKLDREQVRASNKENLLEIINNVNLDDASKQTAIEQMIAMNDVAEREAAAELLLEAKGFRDVIVSITDEQADVVVNKDNLTETERVQIEDIIKRKSGIEVENITISAVYESTSGTVTDNNTENITDNISQEISESILENVTEGTTETGTEGK